LPWHPSQRGLDIVGVKDSGQVLVGYRQRLGQVVGTEMGKIIDEVAHQALGLLLVLLLRRLLRGGKEYPLPVRVVDQQGRVHLTDIAAMGARDAVDAPFPDTLGQVGLIGEINDQPDFGSKSAPALQAS
jgi:hypothetical protein